VNFVKEGGLETKGLVNLALASSGATVSVSQENPDRQATKLIDGITSSENWDQGEGWEVKYEGFFSRGEYVGYGVEDPMVVMERLRDRNRDDDDAQDFNSGDPNWRGLRTETRFGNIDTAMGWVVIQFPDEKTVNRSVIYTVDSGKYPADKFGIADITIQYWSSAGNSWAIVDRIGKAKGKAGNSIQDNKSGVITVRFQPVKTSRLRFIIRWTNDSKSIRRGYYQYTMGTIRIAEIEVYGYEKEEESIVQAKSIGVTQDANKTAEINVVIDNYVEGYDKKNIEMLMSSISDDYMSNGETYIELKERLESVFAKYDKVNIDLSDLKVKLTENGAVVSSTYKLLNESLSDSASRIEKSGTIKFELTNETGYWRINGISTQ